MHLPSSGFGYLLLILLINIWWLCDLFMLSNCIIYESRPRTLNYWSVMFNSTCVLMVWMCFVCFPLFLSLSEWCLISCTLIIYNLRHGHYGSLQLYSFLPNHGIHVLFIYAVINVHNCFCNQAFVNCSCGWDLVFMSSERYPCISGKFVKLWDNYCRLIYLPNIHGDGLQI